MRLARPEVPPRDDPAPRGPQVGSPFRFTRADHGSVAARGPQVGCHSGYTRADLDPSPREALESEVTAVYACRGRFVAARGPLVGCHFGSLRVQGLRRIGSFARAVIDNYYKDSRLGSS
jgi:hypothetical protein